jgi:hypothetical protein
MCLDCLLKFYSIREWNGSNDNLALVLQVPVKVKCAHISKVRDATLATDHNVVEPPFRRPRNDKGAKPTVANEQIVPFASLSRSELQRLVEKAKAALKEILPG